MSLLHKPTESEDNYQSKLIRKGFDYMCGQQWPAIEIFIEAMQQTGGEDYYRKEFFQVYRDCGTNILLLIRVWKQQEQQHFDSEVSPLKRSLVCE